jgi:hypothetical protein
MHTLTNIYIIETPIHFYAQREKEIAEDSKDDDAVWEFMADAKTWQAYTPAQNRKV